MLVMCSIGRTSHQSLILYTVARLDTRWRDIEDGNGLPVTDGMASTMLMTFTTSTLTVENLMPKIMEEWCRRGASSSSVHMARSSLNKRKPMPKWQGNSSAGSSTSFKGSYNKKQKGKSSFRPNPQLLEQRIAPLQPQQQWPGQQPGQSRGGNWKRNAGKRKDGKAKKRAAMAVSGPSFATEAMAMIVEEMPDLTIDESSIQSSQTTFPIRDKGKQRAIEIFPEQEELVSPDAECILSDQDKFFESPEEFMDDSLDYGDPNEISFKTDDRYADYEFKTEEHAHQHAVEVLNDHINEINYYDDSRGQYHLVDSHDPIALFGVCKYNISYDDDIINDDAFNHFCKNHYTEHECCSLCRYHDTNGNKTSIHNAFIALGNVLNSSLTSYRACLNNSLNCPCPTCKLKYTGKASWLCDSGASDHFTYDHRDFVEYEAFPIPQEVKTADSTSKIPGQGT